MTKGSQSRKASATFLLRSPDHDKKTFISTSSHWVRSPAPCLLLLLFGCRGCGFTRRGGSGRTRQRLEILRAPLLRHIYFLGGAPRNNHLLGRTAFDLIVERRIDIGEVGQRHETSHQEQTRHHGQE